MKAEIIAGLASHNDSILLKIINDNPTWFTIHDIAHGFWELAKTHPTDVEKIANTIVAVRDAPCAPVISANIGNYTNNEALANILSSEIFDMLKAAFSTSGSDLDSTSTIHPQNPLFITAMLAGACARSTLCFSGVQDGYVTCGLQLDDSEYMGYLTPAEYEINALHACLHLLVAGSAGFATGHRVYEMRDVLPGLRSIAKKGVIKSANGKNLLRVRYRSFLTCLD